MEDKGISVRREDERDVERYGVFQGLLETRADGVVVVLGLDDGYRDIRLVVKDVIGALRLATGNKLASHYDPAPREVNFLANLGHVVPACLLHRRSDEL
jgi:hypothetical protein